MTEQAGAAIRAFREARGLSLRALSAEVGVSPATMSALERGLTPLTLSRLDQVAEALGVPVAEVLGGQATGGGSRPVPATRAAEEPGAWRNFGDLALGPVLEAATRLFVRQGYHGTSMREVAEEAGVSVAGIYHHYASKERILVALLDVTMAEIAWRVEAARLQGRDPLESFALMVEALALFHAVRGDLAFLGASEMRAFSPEERSRITGLRDDVQHALDRQAQRCADAGLVPTGDLRTATRAIATMCTSLPSWFRAGGPMAPAEVARRYARFAVTMVEGRLPGDGPR